MYKTHFSELERNREKFHTVQRISFSVIINGANAYQKKYIKINNFFFSFLAYLNVGKKNSFFSLMKK